MYVCVCVFINTHKPNTEDEIKNIISLPSDGLLQLR